VLLVPVSLLCNLGALLPLRTYYFRDFSATFYPLRLFLARELREGRFPSWNPYVFEGAFQLPVLYPADLVHSLWPSPVLLSWLLTLHLPLAALAAYWLCRELGVSREGAFVGGATYALGGLALSSLNLYVFLQALALAPLVAGLLRRAARDGGRAVAVAAVALAVALSTLAVEFVGQAILLGIALGLIARPSWRGLTRSLGALALGVGLAGLPLALTLGLLPETVRGAGFAPDVALGNAVHPAVLLQTVLPRLFGLPQAPAEAWWGGRFFSKGLPYFLSLYLGPVALALAAVGLGAMARAQRLVLLALGGAGLWYALGEAGGLATVVARLPLASSFRFPGKAMLLPYLAVAVAAAFGSERLRRDRRAWRRLAAVAGSLAALALAVALLVGTAPPGLVAWTGVAPGFWPHVVRVVSGDAGVVVTLGAASAVLALVVQRERLGPGAATAALIALALADLTRAGAGVNPQAPGSFFTPLPEMERLELATPDGERVFSYGLQQSPSFREFLGRGGPGLTLVGTYLNRQILAPYTNVLDQVETPEATDLTSFVPRDRELEPSDYDPAAVPRLLPWLRNAAVSRVVSLDPLSHPDLSLMAVVPVGPPGLAIHAYRLADPWPRAYVACRVVAGVSREEALFAPYREGFEPAGEVALEGGGVATTCRSGRARRTAFVPGQERYEVESDGAGYLVTRDSYARGWRARVDGHEAPVLRANGKHRAVPLPGGAREVRLSYHPPGLRVGLVATGLSLLSLLALWIQAPSSKGDR